MSRITKVAIGILIVVILFQIDYWNVRRKEKQLARAVAAIGGKNSSIPFYPFGTEYIIVLSSVPTDQQLSDLEIANHMRGVVGIGLKDCPLTEGDVHRLQTRLASCKLFVLDKEDNYQPLAASVLVEKE